MVSVYQKESTGFLHGAAEQLPVTIVEPDGVGEINMGCGWYRVAPGKECKLHVHQRKTETWFIVQGSGLLRLGDDEVEVSAGCAIFTPPGTPHSIRNTGKEPILFVDVTYPRIGRDPETGMPLDSTDLEE
ncbi:MAG: cupin domain-containing protein [Trueperaceae bacterium]